MRVNFGSDDTLDITTAEVNTALSILLFLSEDNTYTDLQSGLEEARLFVADLTAADPLRHGPQPGAEDIAMNDSDLALFEEAMDYARTALRDLGANYSLGELAEPLEDTLGRLDEALRRLGMDEEGASV